MQEHARFQQHEIEEEEQRWRLNERVDEASTVVLGVSSRSKMCAAITTVTLTQTPSLMFEREVYVVYTWLAG